jgi:hypothetical protein
MFWTRHDEATIRKSFKIGVTICSPFDKSFIGMCSNTSTQIPRDWRNVKCRQINERFTIDGAQVRQHGDLPRARIDGS